LLDSIFSRFRNRRGRLSPAQRRQWEDDGLVILPGLVKPEKVRRMRALIDRLWAERRREDNPLVIDLFYSADDRRRIHFRDAPDEGRNVVYKLNDVYLVSGPLRRLVLSDSLAPILSDLLDGDAIICNSLLFERGSEQAYHFDTWYMPPVVENKMVASWIALEDVAEQAGPLSYYPGSHKIPPYRFSHGGIRAVDEEMASCREYVDRQIQERGLTPAVFRPKAGDVLIWHAQLFHGGMPIQNPDLTRTSVVTHYFRYQDTQSRHSREFAPGRYFMKRPHAKVPN